MFEKDEVLRFRKLENIANITVFSPETHEEFGLVIGVENNTSTKLGTVIKVKQVVVKYLILDCESSSEWLRCEGSRLVGIL